jgi:hypothetical protein
MKMTAERRALDKIYRRRDRYDIPDWQREFRGQYTSFLLMVS